MPLWHVYHPPDTFNDYHSKAALSKAITTIYTNVGLPAFHVNVYFHGIPGEDIWIGGVPQTAPSPRDIASLPRPFIRPVGENVAVNMGDDTVRRAKFTNRVVKYLAPHIQDKGKDWEFHVDETSRDLWRVQGLRAPPVGSEPFNLWVKGNRAVPREEPQEESETTIASSA